jgi:hypothetical protein
VGSLQIGRVVLPIKEQAIVSQRQENGLTVSGWLEISEDDAERGLAARTYRDDLLGHMREAEVVPVVSDGVAQLDGFYRVVGVELVTIAAGTVFDFSVDLAFAVAGSWAANDIYFQSRLAGGLMTNDFSITTAAEPILAPPVGHEGFDPGATIPVTMTRALASGDSLTIYRDVTVAQHPKWSVSPEDYYVGAVQIERI